jgi:aromatic ring hydroxylase
LERADTIEFENILKDRANELNSKLKESSNIRESEILNNEIDTLESVLDCLSDLKYGDKTRAIEIAETSNNYQHVRRLREELCNIQDTEYEISAQIQNKIEKL